MQHAQTIRLADMATRARERDTSVVAPRKMRALINVGGNQIMRGHTLSVALDHLTVSVPTFVEPGSDCNVFFGLTIGDQIYSIIGSGTVATCEGSEAEGYRAEMSFSVADKKSRIVIEQLFGSHDSVRVQ